MSRQVGTGLSKSGNAKQLKMNRSGLISYIAETKDIPFEEAEYMYNTVVDSICSVVASGVRLSLQGFGAFYLQLHKGQPVRFSSTQSVAKDYYVFKFSASSVLNQWFRQVGVAAE